MRMRMRVLCMSAHESADECCCACPCTCNIMPHICMTEHLCICNMLLNACDMESDAHVQASMHNSTIDLRWLISDKVQVSNVSRELCLGACADAVARAHVFERRRARVRGYDGCSAPLLCYTAPSDERRATSGDAACPGAESPRS